MASLLVGASRKFSRGEAEASIEVVIKVFHSWVCWEIWGAL